MSAPKQVENDLQEAIINQNKNPEDLKIKPMLAKRAQILKKDRFKDGIKAEKGKPVKIEWEVKNFTNQDWSDDVIILCLPSSDIYINEQRTNLSLKKAAKGAVGIEFILPKDTCGKDELFVDLALFDRKANKPIGEVLKVKLVITQ